jgi:hypothetical protein
METKTNLDWWINSIGNTNHRKNLFLFKTRSGGTRLVNKEDFNSIQWAITENINDLANIEELVDK